MNESRAELANRFSPDVSVAPRRIVHHVQGRQQKSPPPATTTASSTSNPLELQRRRGTRRLIVIGLIAHAGLKRRCALPLSSDTTSPWYETDGGLFLGGDVCGP